MAEIEWITQLDRFRSIREPWDLLAMKDPDPFQRHAWLVAWWECFAGGADVRVCAVWRGDELAAGLPLCIEDGRAESMSKEQWVPLRPLAVDDAAIEKLSAAVLALPVGELVFDSALSADPRAKALEQSAARAFWERPDRFTAVETNGDFADYRKRMKSRWGSIERKGRKLQRDHDAEVRLVEPPADLESQLDAGFELEAQGWKGRAGSALLTDPLELEFFTRAIRAFHMSGEVRFSEIVADGNLVAWDVAVLHANRLHSLKTAYDERRSTLSPGLVLRRAMIERCFQLGLDAHELLGPDMEWKRRFATSARENGTLRLYPGGAIAIARYAYRRSLRPRLKQARDLVRNRPHRPPAEERWPPPASRAL